MASSSRGVGERHRGAAGWWRGTSIILLPARTASGVALFKKDTGYGNRFTAGGEAEVYARPMQPGDRNQSLRGPGSSYLGIVHHLTTSEERNVPCQKPWCVGCCRRWRQRWQ